MRVLDLCTEFGSETAAFRDRGHEVVMLGIEGNVDIKCDVRQWYPSIDDKYDFITAHPPCTEFSIAKGIACKDRNPDMSIVEACFRIIYTLKPKYWILENPRGCLRYFIGKPTITIKYSDYGYPCHKPTDLWGEFPFFYSTTKREPTINMMYAIRSVCHGTGNWDKITRKANRSMVPYGLSLAICKAIERDMIVT